MSEAAKPHQPDQGRPNTEGDVDTDDVTERQTGQRRDPYDENAGVTMHDVLEALNAENIEDRPGEPAERRWEDEIVSPVTDAEIQPPQ